MLHGLRTIAAACDRFPDVARRVLGIHVEGPFHLGARGLPRCTPSRCDSRPELAASSKSSSEPPVVESCSMTLAPERNGAIEFIRRATAAGIVVALGHTAAPGSVIRDGRAAGARLSTHLGNGIAQLLPRHPNPIWEQAALESLWASFIADGHHLDLATLRVLAMAKGPGHTILVSDASPLGGSATRPLRRMGGRAIRPNRRRRHPVPGRVESWTRNRPATTFSRATGWTIEQAMATVTTNPARLLGRPRQPCAQGEPGDLIVFRRPRPGELILRTSGLTVNWRQMAGVCNPPETTSTGGLHRSYCRLTASLQLKPAPTPARQALPAGSLPSTQSPSSFW